MPVSYNAFIFCFTRSKTILTIVLDSLNLNMWVLKSFENSENTQQGHNVVSQKKGVFSIFC
jgi:hypothetical protein